MKKAVVLTYAKISDEEKELLKNTDVFKIACNTYCADLKPDLRLTADNIVDNCLNCDTCDVVSLNYDLNKKRVINAQNLPKRHSSLLSCIDFLFFKKYTHILLIADNTQNNGHDIENGLQKINKEGINNFKHYLNLYKYSVKGVFDIPQKNIKEFLMEDLIKEAQLDDEDKILGAVEPAKKLLDFTVLTDACLFEISTKGKNNKSIENGELLDTILPQHLKSRLLKGMSEIEYNDLLIKRITKIETDIENKIDEDIENTTKNKKTGKNK